MGQLKSKQAAWKLIITNLNWSLFKWESTHAMRALIMKIKRRVNPISYHLKNYQNPLMTYWMGYHRIHNRVNECQIFKLKREMILAIQKFKWEETLSRRTKIQTKIKSWAMMTLEIQRKRKIFGNNLKKSHLGRSKPYPNSKRRRKTRKSN